MASSSQELSRRPVQLSLLDRLSNLPDDFFVSNSTSRRRFEESVLEDLTHLLNTWLRSSDLSEESPEVAASVRWYGVKDFSDLGTDDDHALRAAEANIKTAIDRFEPRLRNVRVSLRQIPERPSRPTYRITAQLMVRPHSVPIEFDAVIAGEDNVVHVRATS